MMLVENKNDKNKKEKQFYTAFPFYFYLSRGTWGQVHCPCTEPADVKV